MEVGIRNGQILSDEEVRFAGIYRRYGKHIRAYCTRRTDGSDVADAVAETFLVAWRKIEQIPEGDATLRWLYGVAYRVLSHQWRHKRRSRRLVERLSGLADVETPSTDIRFVAVPLTRTRYRVE
jgi:RNA polymerase sigma-70 factor (ECF subfamily)